MNVPGEVSLVVLRIARLEARARAANNVAEFSFSIANDAYSLLGFRQALVFDGGAKKAASCLIPGLARPTEDSPYLVRLRRTWPGCAHNWKLILAGLS